MLLGVYELEPPALEHRRGAVGLRHRADPARHRTDRSAAGGRLRPLPVPGRRRDQEVGQRRVHLHPGRQPAGRPGARPARVLDGLRGDGRVQPGRRRRAGPGRMDGARRAEPRRVRHGRRPVRRLRRRPRLPAGDDRAVLLAPVRDDLPQRAAAGRAPAEDVGDPRRPGGRRGALGHLVGPGDAAVLRRGPTTSRRWRRAFVETPTLRRSNAFDIVGREVRATREGVGLLDTTAFARYAVTGPGAQALAGPAACRAAPRSGWDPAGADAQPVRTAARRPHRDLLGRGRVLADRLVLPAASGTCAGSPLSWRPSAGAGRRRRGGLGARHLGRRGRGVPVRSRPRATCWPG